MCYIFFQTELLPVLEGSCTTIKVRALRQGHTEVKAQYEYGSIKLSASVVIAAYNPLKVSLALILFSNFIEKYVLSIESVMFYY